MIRVARVGATRRLGPNRSDRVPPDVRHASLSLRGDRPRHRQHRRRRARAAFASGRRVGSRPLARAFPAGFQPVGRRQPQALSAVSRARPRQAPSGRTSLGPRRRAWQRPVRRRPSARPLPALGGDEPRRIRPRRGRAHDLLGPVRQPVRARARHGNRQGHLRHRLRRGVRNGGDDGRHAVPLAPGAIRRGSRPDPALGARRIRIGRRVSPHSRPSHRRAVPDQGLGGAGPHSSRATSRPIPTSPPPSAIPRPRAPSAPRSDEIRSVG